MRRRSYEDPAHDTPDLDHFGFVCPSCNFRFVLSDLQPSVHVVEAFKHGTKQVDLECPECTLVHAYTPTDLVWFSLGGREVRISKQQTL